MTSLSPACIINSPIRHKIQLNIYERHGASRGFSGTSKQSLTCCPGSFQVCAKPSPISFHMPLRVTTTHCGLTLRWTNRSTLCRYDSASATYKKRTFIAVIMITVYTFIHQPSLLACPASACLCDVGDGAACYCGWRLVTSSTSLPSFRRPPKTGLRTVRSK